MIERRGREWAVVVAGEIWWWAKTEAEARAYLAGIDAATAELAIR